MGVLLKLNHRIFKYQTVFGSTTDFLPTLLVDAGYLDIEPTGNVNCTCYTVDKIGSAETGRRYDHNWLWTQMVKLGKATASGASPEDAFSVGIKGLKVVPTGEIDMFSAYFQTEIGQFDFFTNVKSAIQIEHNKGLKRPVGCGTFWYMEWNKVPANGTMPEGKIHVSDHEWVVCGWDKEHPDCFKIDSHQGYYMYMPRDVFNKAMDATYGSVALTIAETKQEVIDFEKERNYSRIQSIIDSIYNALKIIKAQIQLLVKKNEPVPIPMKTTKITQWAKAIQNAEDFVLPGHLYKNQTVAVNGSVSYRNNNPGNLKLSSLTQSWGATKGSEATDGGYFAKFADYNVGFLALCNFLALGCHDELKAFHQARTLQKFTKVYAGNPPQSYLDSVVTELGVSPDIDISTFLT